MLGANNGRLGRAGRVKATAFGAIALVHRRLRSLELPGAIHGTRRLFRRPGLYAESDRRLSPAAHIA